MTTTFVATVSNDFALDDRGFLAVRSGAEAVASDARSAIQAQRGEMVLAVAEGMPTAETAWNGYRPGQFEAAARRVLLGVPGVRAVEDLTAERDGEVLRYHATLISEFGPVAISGSL